MNLYFLIDNSFYCDIIIFCRSLVAYLGAAGLYKIEHLRKPENWALGE